MRTCILALILLLAGCASSTAPQPAAPTAARSTGTIVSVRAVPPRSVDTPQVLVVETGRREEASLPMAEFIVRTDDGTTLSIVQEVQSDLHAGDRVMILRDHQTRLARLG
jgi:outer membrane lipoprotein SlyB